MLFWKKICLIWNFSKIEQIRSKMISSLKIKIIFHKMWQISDFSIFKSLNDIMSQMIIEYLKNEILKSCYKSYRNFWFLIKKKSEKYQFINATLKINKITIWNANFFFSINDFSKQFVDYMMIFLMNLFLKYDQFFLIEIFRNLIEFQISIELIQMMIFFSKND